MDINFRDNFRMSLVFGARIWRLNTHPGCVRCFRMTTISENTTILMVRVPYRLPYFMSSWMADADFPPFAMLENTASR